MVPKLFLVGPLKAQGLSDSFDYQQLRTEIYCVKKLEARIKVHHEFHSDVTYYINEYEEPYQRPY